MNNKGMHYVCIESNRNDNNKKLKIMKKLVSLAMLALLTCTGMLQAQTVKEMTREEKKVAQKALDQLLFDEAKQAIDNKTFVLEADQVVFKRGESAFVSSNTNFVAVKKDNAVVQVAFNIPVSGPNGIGGVTVTGSISNYKMSTNKRGDIQISMNVMGTAISAQVNMTLYNGSDNATVEVSPNFSSNRFTLNGRLVPMQKANVYKGQSL